MSKRWKVRQANAAKLEKSGEVIDQFYGNVISELERMKASIAAKTFSICSAHQTPVPGCPRCNIPTRYV